MDVEVIFTSDLVVGVPTTAAEYHRKTPGTADSNGDGDLNIS